MAWWSELFSELTWLAKSHQQMYDDIHGGPGYGGGQGTVEHYDKADRALQAIHQRIEQGVRELSASWSGGAADQATALTRASADWAAAAGVATIDARGQSLHQASAFVDARNKMPEPQSVPDIMSGKGFPAANLIVDIVRAKERADAAHQEAARVMKSYEVSTSQHIGAMPQYPAVQTMVTSTVVAPPTQPPPPGGGNGGGGASQPGDDGGPSGPGTPVPPGGPGAGPPPPGPQPPGPGPGPDGPGSVSSSGEPAPGTGTSGNAFQPSSPSLVGPGPGPAPGVDVVRPGSPITTGVPVGFGPFGGNNPATPGTGQGLPGTGRGGPGEGGGRGGSSEGGGRGGVTRGPGGGAGAADPGPSTAARGAAGARGGAGAQGMMPGAGRSNREEDQEHQRKYVVLDDAHLEDDNPPSAPPVIGGTPY